MFLIKNLSVALPTTQKIINNVSLTIMPGTVHALMGSNGSGKSTLAYTLMGHPNYCITSGSMHLHDNDITHLSPDKRAKLGIFLAFQHPLEIPGVTVLSFLKSAYQAVSDIQLSVKEFQNILFETMDILHMDHSFAYRNLNEGFSGGEKKRLEMLQMMILKPSLVILDEIDSGLDIDALKIVIHSIHVLKKRNPCVSFMVITHYPRMLDYLKPDHVHIMHQGTIAASGDVTLIQHIEEKGYDAIGL